ncbi:MAG: hypothetical protein VZR36_03220 [Prevotella sp.]|nr:hypothetical protein [Prevotella sp.]
MKDMDVSRNVGFYFDNSFHDKLQEHLERLRIYPSCWFIHKGDIYSDIPFLYNDTIHTHKMDIKFNWDNSVTISEGDHKHDIHVNKVLIEPKLYPFSDNDYPFKHHETYDSLFVGIFMIDNSKNEIDIYRQKSSMPYKGRRVGFRIVIDGKVYVTEGKERFNY